MSSISPLFEEFSSSKNILNLIETELCDGILQLTQNSNWEEKSNISLKNLLGFPIGKNYPGFFNLVQPSDLTAFLDAVGKISSERGGKINFILRAKHANGKRLHLQLIGQRLNADSPDLLFFIKDQTAKIEQEDLTFQCNLASKIGYWNIDLETQKPYWSRVTRLIHEVPDDFQPDLKTAIDFYKDGHSKELIQRVVKNALEKGEPYDVELILLTYNKEEKWVRAIGLPEFADGKCIRLYGTFQDIHQRKINRLKLQAEQAKFKNAIEGTNLGTWEWNVQTGETVFNERWAEITGYTLAELAPISIETWTKLAHPEDLEVSSKKLQDCFEKKTDFYECEARMKHKNGHWVWVYDRGKVFSWTEDGKPLMMFGTHQDITETKNEIEHQAIFIQQAPTSIAMFNKEMNYLSASSKWIRDYGLNGKKIIGNSFFNTFPKSTQNWQEIFEDSLKGNSRKKDEEKLVYENGEIQWIKWECKPWYNKQGNIGGALMYTQDITKVKETAEQLKISMSAFQRNFENAGIGMAIVSIEGHWKNVNDRLCEMIGYSREELLKLTFQDITHPEDLNADLELLYETIRGERQTYQIEKRYFHKNGEEIHALLSVSAVRDTEDKLLYFISQIIDITDLKHAQAQIEKLLQTSEDQNERLKNFAHIVSHNLRSHSGGMVQLLEFLEIESPEYFQNELVELLKQASDNLKETIEHLTQIVNVNLQSSYPKKAIILYDVVEKTLQSLQMTSQKSDVKLINEVDPALKVMAIPAYLDSIVLNFLTNGIKYQDPDKNSFVKVKTIIHPDTIEIQFEDNGLGIDLERYSNSLFGMYKTFHKHDDSRGVGLYITKNQIEAMGGKIEVESKVRVGTIFKVFLTKN